MEDSARAWDHSNLTRICRYARVNKLMLMLMAFVWELNIVYILWCVLAVDFVWIYWEMIFWAALHFEDSKNYSFINSAKIHLSQAFFNISRLMGSKRRLKFMLRFQKNQSPRDKNFYCGSSTSDIIIITIIFINIATRHVKYCKDEIAVVSHLVTLEAF